MMSSGRFVVIVRPLRFDRSSPDLLMAHAFMSSKLATVPPWFVALHTSMAILWDTWLQSRIQSGRM